MKQYLGVDIGGSKIKVVMMDGLHMQKARSVTFPTPLKKKFFLEALNEICREFAGVIVLGGIGVGVPGIVRMRRGILLKAPNVPFLDGWNPKSFFKKWASEVRVDNDSRCFLRAEAYGGVARGRKNIVALTIGTGIGGAIMCEGKIYYGSHDSAGEFGHMIIEKHVTLENLGARRAATRQGDRSEIIGIGAANIINAFDPEIVVLGGGGVMSGAIVLGEVRRTAQKLIMSPASKKTPIVRGVLGEDAQAIGAALQFYKSDTF